MASGGEALFWNLSRVKSVGTGMKRTLMAIGLSAVTLCVVMAVIFTQFRSDSRPPPAADATPTTGTPACPVDQTICDFAEKVEFTYREGDIRTLLSSKSQFYPDIGVLDAGIGSWRDRPYYPHIIGIGCTVAADGSVCREAFSLVLTASPDDQQNNRIDRVLLGFVRDGDRLPIVTTNRLMGGEFNLVTAGVDSGDCALAGATGVQGCTVRFFPYTTGGPVLRPTPTPAVTRTPLPGGDPLSGREVRALEPSAQGSIGYDTTVYYTTGCFGCGRSRVPELYRFYRDASGKSHADDLLGPLLAVTGGYAHTFAADWHGGYFVVGICRPGYCGGESQPTPDAQLALFASRDGGITWTAQSAGLPPDSSLLGFVGSETLVAIGERRGLEYVRRYVLYPSMREVTPPASVGTAEPVLGPNGEVAWRTYGPADGAFDSSGRLIVGSSPDHTLVQLLALPPGWLALWKSAASADGFFGLLDGRGEISGAFRHDRFVDIRGQLPGGLLYGNVELAESFGFIVDGGSAACKDTQPIYPALIDWNTATIHPIIELADCIEGRHVFINAMVARPTVRVSTGPDCLNLRTDPDRSSRILSCIADGVLLPLRLEGSPVATAGWVPVFTPDFSGSGWVSEEFVQR